MRRPLAIAPVAPGAVTGGALALLLTVGCATSPAPRPEVVPSPTAATIDRLQARVAELEARVARSEHTNPDRAVAAPIDMPQAASPGAEASVGTPDTATEAKRPGAARSEATVQSADPSRFRWGLSGLQPLPGR